MKAKPIVILIVFSILSIAWFSPQSDKIKAGNRLYKEGKYGEAMEHYNDVLIDLPQSPYVHYNVGASAYKKGDYEGAVEAYTKSLTTDNPALEEKGYYSIGNCKYKQGERKASTDVSGAIKHYEEALGAYKRAIDLNSKNMDAKFNYEVVQRTLKELQDQQQQMNQQQNQDTDQQNEEKQKQQEDNSQRDHSKEADSQEEQQQESQQGAPEQKDIEQKASAQASEENEEMTKAEALTLLDAMKDEEQYQLILQHKRGASLPEDFKDW